MNSVFRPVFSGGTGRSGTTLVGKILSRHESVLAGNPYELKFVTGKGGLLDLIEGVPISSSTDVSGIFHPIKNGTRLLNILQSKENIKELERRILDDWWERPSKRGGKAGLMQGFSKPALKAEIEKLKSEYKKHPLCSTRNFFNEVIKGHKYFNDSKIFVDTTPTNIERAHQIGALFENARFIHMQRNGKDTISSVLNELWGPKKPLVAIDWWKRKLQLANRATRQLSPGQYLNIRLEDLVTEKRAGTYGEILDFLKISDQEQMSKYFAEEVDGDRAHIGRWKADDRLDAEFHSKFERAVLELHDEGISAY
uniref:sulfotransferase family protein n=1 Tax=Candidatus Planktophila sp. TaxID=2175601 RepID=UPI004048FE9A